MRPRAEARKMASDVARVEQYAHRLIYVDEQANVLHSLCRGEPPRKHKAGNWLNVIAVIGPLWDEAGGCYREVVWLEIGLYRSRPYERAELPGEHGRAKRIIVKRERFLSPTKEQVMKIWPYLEYELLRHSEGVVSGWNEPYTRPDILRTKVKRGKIKTEWRMIQFLKGVRFSVSHTDPELIQLLLESEVVINRHRYRGLARYLGMTVSHLRQLYYSEKEWQLMLRRAGNTEAALSGAEEALLRSRSIHVLPLALHMPKGIRGGKDGIAMVRLRELMEHLKVVVHDGLSYAELVLATTSHLSHGVSLRLIPTKSGARYSTFELLQQPPETEQEEDDDIPF